MDTAIQTDNYKRDMKIARPEHGEVHAFATRDYGFIQHKAHLESSKEAKFKTICDIPPAKYRPEKAHEIHDPADGQKRSSTPPISIPRLGTLVEHLPADTTDIEGIFTLYHVVGIPWNNQ